MEQILMNWTARRAGGAITITGIDTNDQVVKITGISEISRGRVRAYPVAIHADGRRFELR